MKFLLDTHAIIWHFDDDSKLSQKAAEIIKNPESILYISSVSLWEIAIKINIGKLELDFTLNELLNTIRNNDFIILQIEDKYLQGLSDLPFIHRDPFDRLIISTALTENLTIITADENIRKYDVPWVW